MFAKISERFDEKYLATLRKSDVEIISDMFVRNFQLAHALPLEQRLALANLIRDKLGTIERE